MIDPAISAERVKAAMRLFPEEFGLRAFPGRVFTIDETASFVNDAGVVMLYVFVKQDNGLCVSFAKGTVEGLWRGLVALPGQPDPHIVELKDDPEAVSCGPCTDRNEDPWDAYCRTYMDDPNPAPYCPHVIDGNACPICDADSPDSGYPGEGMGPMGVPGGTHRKG